MPAHSQRKITEGSAGKLAVEMPSELKRRLEPHGKSFQDLRTDDVQEVEEIDLDEVIAKDSEIRGREFEKKRLVRSKPHEEDKKDGFLELLEKNGASEKNSPAMKKPIKRIMGNKK